MKSKIFSVLVAGLFCTALQAEAAMIQWTFGGTASIPDTVESLPTQGSFVYDSVTHNFSNLMFRINGTSYAVENGTTIGYAEDRVYVFEDSNYQFSIFNINAFSTANPDIYPESNDTLGFPGAFSTTGTFLIGPSGYVFNMDFVGVEVGNVNTVPLPASALLFAPAVLGLFGLRRKETV